MGYHSSQAVEFKPEVRGLPGTAIGPEPWSPSKLNQPDSTLSSPPQSGHPGRGERRLRTTAGTWARPQRRASSAGLAAPGLARGPGLWGEVPPPLCSAPVRGNLRSVTRILQRATCSPGRAAGAASQTGPAAWVPRAPEAMRALAWRGGRLPLLGKAPRPLPGRRSAQHPSPPAALPLSPRPSLLSHPPAPAVNLAAVCHPRPHPPPQRSSAVPRPPRLGLGLDAYGHLRRVCSSAGDPGPPDPTPSYWTFLRGRILTSLRWELTEQSLTGKRAAILC